MKITQNSVSLLYPKELKTNSIDMYNDKKSETKEVGQGDSVASLIQKQVLEDIKADKIAKKIARGEKLSEKEKSELKKMDPEKLRKAEMANKKREELEERIRNCKNKKEVVKIIAEEKASAKYIMDKGDSKFGEYLMEAINKVESDYYKGNLDKNSKKKEKHIDFTA